MGPRRIVMLMILWLMHRTEGKVTCRSSQLHRDCETLCNTDRNGIISCELRVAVLLPADPTFDISLPKVLPVLGKTIDEGMKLNETLDKAEIIACNAFRTASLKRSEKRSKLGRESCLCCG